METVLIKPLLHRGAEHVALFYKKDTRINNLVRSIKGVKWSRTQLCWYLPLGKENINGIKSKLSSHVNFDAAELNAYLAKRRKVAATVVQKATAATNLKGSKPMALTSAWKVSDGNLLALNRFLEELKLKAYSPSTKKPTAPSFCNCCN